MDGVEAVATDKNSDYQDVFEDRCPTYRWFLTISI